VRDDRDSEFRNIPPQAEPSISQVEKAMKISGELSAPDILKVALLSGILGVFISIPLIYIYRWVVPLTLVRSFVSGCIMGALCYSVFVFTMSRNIPCRTLISFLATFAIIALFSFSFTVLVGRADAQTAFVVAAFSSLLGLITSGLIYRYVLALKKKLHHTQEKLKRSMRSGE